METREWVDSAVKRCPLCMYTFGGTLADRVANAEAEYSYKYFGDYELSPAQMDAVGEMLAMSRLALQLLEALKATRHALVCCSGLRATDLTPEQVDAHLAAGAKPENLEWTIDNERELALIDAAIAEAEGVTP